LQEVINTNGEFCAGVDVWRTNTTLPPRKRIISSDKEDDRTTPSPPPPKADPSVFIAHWKTMKGTLHMNQLISFFLLFFFARNCTKSSFQQDTQDEPFFFFKLDITIKS
jgi:hypothetical protein